jgi:hypothetical protein
MSAAEWLVTEPLLMVETGRESLLQPYCQKPADLHAVGALLEQANSRSPMLEFDVNRITETLHS